MASQQFVPPPQRVDDLTEWERATDVPHMLRDVFRYFYIREQDLSLKEPIGVTLERYLRGSDLEKQEAAKALGKLQLVILNLMLKCSGYDYGMGAKAFVGVPVKEWDTSMLTGNPTLPRNFGNLHQISRQPDQQKFATPNSPSEGWLFRMIDFKENFLKVVQSLTFYEPEDLDDASVKYRLDSTEAKYARKCIGQFLAPVGSVLED